MFPAAIRVCSSLNLYFRNSSLYSGLPELLLIVGEIEHYKFFIRDYNLLMAL